MTTNRVSIRVINGVQFVTVPHANNSLYSTLKLCGNNRYLMDVPACAVILFDTRLLDYLSKRHNLIKTQWNSQK